MSRIGAIWRGPATGVLLLGLLWGAAALWFDGPSPPSWLPATLAVTILPVATMVLIWVRPWSRMVLALAALFALVLLWWTNIPARNDREWSSELARLATAEFNGNAVRIRNLRNFAYRGERAHSEVWETRSYDLDQLVGFDMFVSFWGPRLYAHTIASWEFADGRHLAISIEARREKGEAYSAIAGFFRQFELYYVVADERDVIGLRAAYRGEQVYLYRLNDPRDVARALLRDYLTEINRLAEAPRWYNALVHNCTTTIRYHAQAIREAKPWDWRLLANGYLDELAYERGQITNAMPFDELKRRSDITERAKAAIDQPAFSAAIRAGLPPRGP